MCCACVDDESIENHIGREEFTSVVLFYILKGCDIMRQKDDVYMDFIFGILYLSGK
jgi:hypothetical protein